MNSIAYAGSIPNWSTMRLSVSTWMNGCDQLFSSDPFNKGTDMALFPYARRPAFGPYSSTGMFLGHYVSWICAGIMGAAASVVLAKPLTSLASGNVATTALGGLGALVVVIDTGRLPRHPCRECAVRCARHRVLDWRCDP
jgi:hypothetical protein